MKRERQTGEQELELELTKRQSHGSNRDLDDDRVATVLPIMIYSDDA